VDLLSPFGPAAARAVPDLIRLLDDPEDGMRSRAIRALACVDREEGLSKEKLRKLLKDPDSGIQQSAQWALSRF